MQLSSRFELDRKDAVDKERSRAQKELSALQTAKSADEKHIALLQVQLLARACVCALQAHVVLCDDSQEQLAELQR